MTRSECVDDYFHWLVSKISLKHHFVLENFDKLLGTLFTTFYSYDIPMDANRSQDGLNLRYQYGYESGIGEEPVELYLHSTPCSVLEMMVALAIRIEDFMSDTKEGNRTGHWFWTMVSNLGLLDQINYRYDEDKVSKAIERFLDRNYDKNGQGGLFVIKDSGKDMRIYELWIQAMWYINDLTNNTQEDYIHG